MVRDSPFITRHTSTSSEIEVTVTTETTRPALTGTLADHASAIQTMAHLQETFPGLPSPFVTLNLGATVDLQLGTPDAFEQWRTALEVPAAGTELHVYSDGVWLQAVTAVQGVTVGLSGHGLPITADQARIEQDPAGIAPGTPVSVYSLS